MLGGFFFYEYFTCMYLLLKDGFLGCCILIFNVNLCVKLKAYVIYSFYILSKESIQKNYENCFLFHLKSFFHSQDNQFFVTFFLPFHRFQESDENGIIMML